MLLKKYMLQPWLDNLTYIFKQNSFTGEGKLKFLYRILLCSYLRVIFTYAYLTTTWISLKN